jgi:hypothetical protein
MGLKATVFAAAVLGACLGPASASAQSQGILTCQITLSQFAEDVVAAKSRLNPAQRQTAAEVVDVGRSQCRSTPDLVFSDIQAARVAWNLPTGRRAGNRFSNFWPPAPEELALLSP